MPNTIPHRGERLKAFFEHCKRGGQRVNLQNLMRKLGRSSKTIYNWYDMPDLPDDRIVEVAEHYPEIKKWYPEVNWAAYTANEPPVEYNRLEVPKECEKHIALLEFKYTKLLEAHSALQGEYLELLKKAV